MTSRLGTEMEVRGQSGVEGSPRDLHVLAVFIMVRWKLMFPPFDLTNLQLEIENTLLHYRVLWELLCIEYSVLASRVVS